MSPLNATRTPLRRFTPLKRSSAAKPWQPMHRGTNLPTAERKALELRQCAMAELRLTVFTRDGWRCRRCNVDGREFDHAIRNYHTLDVAHILPLGMGGNRHDSSDPRNEPRNLITLCRTCHLAQHEGRWQLGAIGIWPAVDLAVRWPHLLTQQQIEHLADALEVERGAVTKGRR